MTLSGCCFAVKSRYPSTISEPEWGSVYRPCYIAQIWEAVMKPAGLLLQLLPDCGPSLRAKNLNVLQIAAEANHACVLTSISTHLFMRSIGKTTHDRVFESQPRANNQDLYDDTDTTRLLTSFVQRLPNLRMWGSVFDWRDIVANTERDSLKMVYIRRKACYKHCSELQMWLWKRWSYKKWCKLGTWACSIFMFWNFKWWAP